MPYNKTNLQSQSIIYYGLIALIFSTFFLFVPAASNAFSIKNHIASLGIMILFMAWLYSQPEHIFFPKSLSGAGFCLWLIGCLISLTSAIHFAVGWQQFLSYCPFFLLPLVLFNLEPNNELLKKLEACVTSASLLVALIAIQQYFLPDCINFGFQAQGKMQVYSTLGNPNWVGIILVAAVPIAISTFNQNLLIRLIAVLTLLIGIACTQSRQAVIAVLVIGFVQILWRGSAIQKRGLLITLLISGLTAYYFLNPTLENLPTLKGRVLIANSAIQMMLDHPLGIGMGQFELLYPNYQASLLASKSWAGYLNQATYVGDAHNEFLQWGTTAGVTGFLGFSLYCSILLLAGWRSDKVRLEIPQWYLSLIGITVTLLMTSIQMYAAPTLLMTISTALILRYSQTSAFKLSSTSGFKYSILFISIFLTSSIFYYAARDIKSNLIEGEADQVFQERDLWLAGLKYNEAIETNVYAASAYQKLASVLFLQGRYDDALAASDKAANLSGDASILLLKGEILTLLNQDSKAITNYQLLIKRFPNLVTGHFILAQLYLKQKNWNEAKQEFEAVLNIVPSETNMQMTKEKIKSQKKWAVYYLEMLPKSQLKPKQ